MVEITPELPPVRSLRELKVLSNSDGITVTKRRRSGELTAKTAVRRSDVPPCEVSVAGIHTEADQNKRVERIEAEFGHLDADRQKKLMRRLQMLLKQSQNSGRRVHTTTPPPPQAPLQNGRSGTTNERLRGPRIADAVTAGRRSGERLAKTPLTSRQRAILETVFGRHVTKAAKTLHLPK